MPRGLTNLGSQLLLQIGGSSTNATLAPFETAYNQTHTDFGWESASLDPNIDQLEQTVIDISSSGVLTHAIHPELIGTGTATIRVTIDGELTAFTSNSINLNNKRYWIGDIRSGNNQYGSTGGFGDTNTPPRGDTYAPSPIETMTLGNIGMVFKSSLKVTIQANGSNIISSQYKRNAYVAYTNYIPEGL